MRKSVFMVLALMMIMADRSYGQGTVGIGTTSTTNKLNVNGNLSVGSGYVTNTAPTDGAIIQGKVGLGTTSPAGPLEVIGNSSNIGIVQTNYGNPNDIWLRRAQGSLATPTVIGTNGILGRLIAMGYDGSAFRNAASIHFEADAAPTSSSSPGSIVFSTTPVSATAVTERLRINANGSIGLSGAANTGTVGQVLTSAGSTGPPTWATLSAGTVTSVGLSLPSIFSVSGSPVTTSGTLTGSLVTQTANTVFAGPSSGGAVAPTFRALAAADIPSLDASKITTGTLGIGVGGTGTSTAFTTGSVIFAGTSGVYSQNNANFFWDNTNARLGIGIAAPVSKLQVSGGSVRVTGTTNTNAETGGANYL